MKHPWDRRLGFWWLAEEYPDQPAVVGCPSGVTLTFSELAGRAHRLVHGLRGGPRCRLHLRLCPPQRRRHPRPAARRARKRVPVHRPEPRPVRGRDPAHCRSLGSRGPALYRDFADRVEQMSGTGSIKLRVAVGGDIEGFLSEESLVEGQPTTEPPDRQLGIPIVYSSGTTGQPKAVVRPACPPSTRPWPPISPKALATPSSSSPQRGATWCRPAMHHGGSRASTWVR